MSSHNISYGVHQISLEQIKEQSQKVTKLIRELRHRVEQSNLDLDPEFLTDLARETRVLINAIRQFGIYYGTGILEPIDYFDKVIRSEPELLKARVIEEERLYREDLGFSKQEYEDLMLWKDAIEVNKCDFKGAFNYFADVVIKDLQEAKYKIKPHELIGLMSGAVGIAVDITKLTTSSDIPGFLISCGTGMAAITQHGTSIKDKLLSGRAF